VNRVGKDPDLEYGGRSLIVDPLGKIITEGDENEGIIEANIEKEIIEKWRSQFPVIADIREGL
jgi:predicted amidohydrolase